MDIILLLPSWWRSRNQISDPSYFRISSFQDRIEGGEIFLFGSSISEAHLSQSFNLNAKVIYELKLKFSTVSVLAIC